MKKGCEFCSKYSIDRSKGFACPYCGKVWSPTATRRRGQKKKPTDPRKPTST